jgi:hypothetical protein
MKKIAPIFFSFCIALGAGIFIWAMRHPHAPVLSPDVRSKHPSVSAQKGPLKLTLTLYSDKVPRNGPLWFRLTVTNVGKKPFTIDDPLFAPYFLDDGENLIDYLSDPFKKKNSFHLVVLDDKGREVAQKYQTVWAMEMDPCIGFPDNSFESELLSKAQRRKSRAQFKERAIAEKDFKANWKRLVSPGSSIETIAWSYHGYCKGERKNPPIPPGRFAEFYGLDLSRPGHYRIFAGLNHVPTKKELEEKKKEDQDALEVDKKMGWKSDWYGRKSIPRAEDAVIQTPPIDFEVLP